MRDCSVANVISKQNLNFVNYFFLIEMSDSEESLTPPEIKEAARQATLNLLPLKSKARYESTYKKFLDWCKKENIKKFTENCLLAFFQQRESKKSLWSIYSMLKLCMMVHNNVDISKFYKLIAFLKRATEHHKPKKSAVLDDTHILKFLEEAPDCSYLMMKVQKHKSI